MGFADWLEGSSGDPMALFNLKDVQTILSSAVFYLTQEPAEGA